MKIIGVTGNIASGKNLVSFYLKQLKYRIFDADAVVHDMYQTNRELISNINAIFPNAVCENKVNRGELAKYLIKFPDNWKRLENIVHPVVIQELHKFIFLCRRLHCNNIAINMLLLFEIGADKLCDIVILVKANPEVQRQRLIKRLNYNQSLIKSIIMRQNNTKKRIYRIKTGIEKCQVFNQLIILQQHVGKNDQQCNLHLSQFLMRQE